MPYQRCEDCAFRFVRDDDSSECRRRTPRTGFYDAHDYPAVFPELDHGCGDGEPTEEPVEPVQTETVANPPTEASLGDVTAYRASSDRSVE